MEDVVRLRPAADHADIGRLVRSACISTVLSWQVAAGHDDDEAPRSIADPLRPIRSP